MRALGGLLLLLTLGCGMSYRGYSDVVYDARLQQPSGQMDIDVPQGSSGARPGVLLVHPGGWSSGDKSDLGALADHLARSGYVVANTNYRLKSLYPEPIQDVWCALAFLRANAAQYDLDPTRVALVGYSAGGYLVDMVGLAAAGAPQDADCPSGVTQLPVAVVSGDGPTDLNGIRELSAFDDIPDLVGGPCDDNPNCAADSPIWNVSSGAPPFLLIQGTRDWLVPWQQSASFASALQGAGDSATLLLLRGDGHQLNPGADVGSPDFINFTIESPEGLSAQLAFLEANIGTPPP